VLALLPISMALMLLSGAMLRADWPVRLLAVGLAGSISLAVAGLSTGLGAIFLDLRSRNPAAIVSSFGGTLNLVLSLGFMLLTIVPFGLIFHVRINGLLTPAGMIRAVILLSVWVTLITAATTIIPLRLGARSLSQRDY